MSRKDRFRLKSQLADALGAAEWTFMRTNLLLNEFGLVPPDGDWQGISVPDLISSISDSLLLEMYAIVMGIETTEVEDAVKSPSDVGNWKTGFTRVFLSHSAEHRRVVQEVADEMAVAGIHGFVAHDTLEYSKPWQAQIESALQSMQAFVALVHPEFNSSAWCHQEVGWALGRRVPRYAVRMGATPTAFLGSDQWPSGVGQTPKQVANVVSLWLSTLPELGLPVIDGLLGALEAAGNYVDAGAAAERLAALGTLSGRDFERLNRVWWGNDQLHGGILPTRAMEPFYRQNGRSWPPPKVEPVAPPADRVDEEPF